MKKKPDYTRIIGWYGVVLILLAYYGVTEGIYEPTSIRYNFINLAGASMLCVVFIKNKIWSNLFLEIIFIIIALVAIFKNLF